jgi:hypothetical protein
MDKLQTALEIATLIAWAALVVRMTWPFKKPKREDNRVDTAEALAITDINEFGGQIQFDKGSYKGMYAQAVTEEGLDPVRQGSRVVVVKHDRQNAQFIVEAL